MLGLILLITSSTAESDSISVDNAATAGIAF